MKYKCVITFEEPILGTAPTNQQVYTDFIVSKAIENGVHGIEDEWDTAPIKEDIDRVTTQGMTAFHRDAQGRNILLNYHIRGFMKEACGHRRRSSDTLSSKFTAYKKKIDGQVFVWPRRIPIKLSGPVGILERPLRAQTPQGERVALTSSAQVPAGSSIEFEIEVLSDKEVPEKLLREWLDYGRYIGLGQWRSSAIYGTFDYTLERIA